MPRPGVTVVGYPFRPIGMGEHARSTLRALQAGGVATTLVDVSLDNGEIDPDIERDFRPYLAEGIGSGVNLFCVNGDEAARVIEAGMMTIGLAPVIGIPLPFFSYGGSSMMGFTVLLGILLRLDAERLSQLR